MWNLNYYPHHIGDFIKSTANLTHEERSIYLQLIWKYYDTEKPLTDDIESLAFDVGARDKCDTILSLLKRYFVYETHLKSYTHQRIEAEITKYRAKADSAKRALESRWPKKPLISDVITDTVSDAYQIPTNNQEPITNKTLTSSDDDKSVVIDYQGIVDLYNKILPELPAVRLITNKRRSAIKSCATTKPKYSGLDFWEHYFQAVRQSEFLMGRTSSWKADFDFLVTHSKFIKIIEGGYK